MRGPCLLISVLYASTLMHLLQIINVALGWPCLDETNSSFQIYNLKQAAKKCKLHKKLRKQLKQQKFTKIMCPFGVLVVGTSNYPDELLKYGANIVANLIDNDNDGQADDTKVLNFLAHNGKLNHGTSLVCGTSQKEEAKEQYLTALDYTYSCQTWQGSNEGEKSVKAIMVEEAFHMVHQNGWARAYPEVLGLDDFTSSVVCREAASLQCVQPGWWHPENKCPNGAPFLPGNPAASPLQRGDGDCTESNCDCSEYYRQAMTLYTGWDDLDFWYSDYMPSSKQEFEQMSSSELLSMMADPKYNQPQSPLSGVYENSVKGTYGKGKGGCTKNCECGKSDQNGEEACENHGYSKNECNNIGCCNFDDGECWSSVGQDLCVTS